VAYSIKANYNPSVIRTFVSEGIMFDLTASWQENPDPGKGQGQQWGAWAEAFARLADALPLMADVSQRPTFPAQALDRVRQQRLVMLLSTRDDPDAIAALAFARGIYGPSHRNAAAQIGAAESIKALTTEDLKAFHRSAYRPGNSTLIVVGDVASDRVLPLLETHFGKWQPAGTNRVVREPAPAVQRPPRQLILVDMPSAPQSRILIGGVGASSLMSDFFPIQVLNAVLRGRLSSDRNPTLRDYAAGVRSGFDMRKSAGPFVVAAAAQTDKTAESLGELLNELTGMLKGVPADELARAKDDIALHVPTTFEATGRISNRLRALESLVVYGLPDDYYSNFVPAIQAVGAVDVQRVAQQYIQPDHLAMVIVGDRKTIEPRIRALTPRPKPRPGYAADLAIPCVPHTKARDLPPKAAAPSEPAPTRYKTRRIRANASSNVASSWTIAKRIYLLPGLTGPFAARAV